MRLSIAVDGNTYEVDVEVTEPERHTPVPWSASYPVHLPALATPVPDTTQRPAPANDAKVCRSPVNGTVVRVAVEPGQSVQADDVLITLEAMKMETNITAPISAVVARVDAEVGSAVRSGAVLVEFE